eukprot:5475213-Pyramimonas_sp.AAC.1
MSPERYSSACLLNRKALTSRKFGRSSHLRMTSLLLRWTGEGGGGASGKGGDAGGGAAALDQAGDS